MKSDRHQPNNAERPPYRSTGPGWLRRLRHRVSLAGLAAAFGSNSVLAAEAPGAAEAPPASGLYSDPARSASGDARVEQLNDQGSALYAAGDYRRAVEHFIEAYAVDQDPNLLFNIASCYEGLGDVDAALEKYRAFLNAPDADPDGRPRAERAIARLSEAASPTPEPPLPPPSAPAPPASAVEPGPPSWAAWVGLGGGAALGVTGATLYLLGAADHADVTNTSGYGDAEAVVAMTRAEADDLVHSGNVKKSIGVGVAAAGGALLTGYLVWWLLDRAPDDTAPTVQLSVNDASAGLFLSGPF
jgi:tetratricopeptide (TPR) repeat protein